MGLGPDLVVVVGVGKKARGAGAWKAPGADRSGMKKSLYDCAHLHKPRVNSFRIISCEVRQKISLKVQFGCSMNGLDLVDVQGFQEARSQ
jgi:hypothetical protein